MDLLGNGSILHLMRYSVLNRKKKKKLISISSYMSRRFGSYVWWRLSWNQDKILERAYNGGDGYGYQATHREIEWFWEIVEGIYKEKKMNLLELLDCIYHMEEFVAY